VPSEPGRWTIDKTLLVLAKRKKLTNPVGEYNEAVLVLMKTFFEILIYL